MRSVWTCSIRKNIYKESRMFWLIKSHVPLHLLNWIFFFETKRKRARNWNPVTQTFARTCFLYSNLTHTHTHSHTKEEQKFLIDFCRIAKKCCITIVLWACHHAHTHTRARAFYKAESIVTPFTFTVCEKKRNNFSGTILFLTLSCTSWTIMITVGKKFTFTQ